MRKIIGIKDDFYYRYIIKGSLFKPIVEAFLANGSRYNLLNSAIIELFEFIKMVSSYYTTIFIRQILGRMYDN